MVGRGLCDCVLAILLKGSHCGTCSWKKITAPLYFSDTAVDTGYTLCISTTHTYIEYSLRYLNQVNQ